MRHYQPARAAGPCGAADSAGPSASKTRRHTMTHHARGAIRRVRARRKDPSRAERARRVRAIHAIAAVSRCHIARFNAATERNARHRAMRRERRRSALTQRDASGKCDAQGQKSARSLRCWGTSSGQSNTSACPMISPRHSAASTSRRATTRATSAASRACSSGAARPGSAF